MWLYQQSTGRLYRLVATGYSGLDECKNNPACEAEHDRGPLPRGHYLIGAPFDDPAHCGPYCLRLTPAPGNDMHGRAGFLVHGDSVSQPGEASHGCLIMPLAIRQQLHQSGDYELEVIA